jgi:hypothetical protein
MCLQSCLLPLELVYTLTATDSAPECATPPPCTNFRGYVSLADVLVGDRMT